MKEYVIGTAVFVVKRGSMTCRTLDPVAYFSRRSKAAAFIAKDRKLYNGDLGVSARDYVYQIEIIPLDNA